MLAICYVRIGICRDDAKLIQKGFSLLELTDETSILAFLKKKWRSIINRKKYKSRGDFLDFSNYSVHYFLIPAVVKPEVLAADHEP